MVAHITNVDVTELPVYLPYYIADELLGLPKTRDWIRDVSVEASKGIYANQADGATGSFPEQLQDKPPTHPLCEFVGHYTHPFWGEISIRQGKEKDSVDKDLYFNMRMFDSKMTPYHYDTFQAQLHDFVVNYAALMSFQTGKDGKVSGLRLDVGGILAEYERKKD